jgi:hypothetical protein
MRIFIKTSQDATIYQQYPNLNVGLDEILEVGKLTTSPRTGSSDNVNGAVRSLLNFDGIQEGAYPVDAEYYLNLYLSDAKNINRYQTIEICPVSSSWIEGSGYFYQSVKNVEDGVTWNVANITYNVPTFWSIAGGDFTTTVTSSYEFSKIPLTSNVRINITNIIYPLIEGLPSDEAIASGSASALVPPWNGLMIKFPTADETNPNNIGNFKFFSGNTHTVFEPNIEVVWASQIFVTGSLKPLPSSNVSIIPKNIKESYIQNEIDKIYLIIRDKYPDKRFDSTQRYKNTYYLPSESYFRIRDAVSDVELYRFDEFSAVNCDASGSYITLDTRGFNIGRFYSIDLKVKSGELVFFPEFNYTFKIENNE